MEDAPSTSRAPSPSPLPCGPIFAGYLLLGGVLGYVLIARWFLPLYMAEPVSVATPVAASPAAGSADPDGTLPDTRIDPNTADWPELTRLPGIGEVIAKRIVAYRQEHQSPSNPLVFRSAEDLARVKGIGPKTVEKIREHLFFTNSPNSAAPVSPGSR